MPAFRENVAAVAPFLRERTGEFKDFNDIKLLSVSVDHLRRLPLALRLLQRFPVLRRIPARLIGLGLRPEHVRTPDTAPGRSA